MISQLFHCQSTNQMRGFNVTSKIALERHEFCWEKTIDCRFQGNASRLHHSSAHMRLLRKLLSRQQRAGSGTRVQLQVLSDLHLEVGQQYRNFEFAVSAPLLVLAGDIGRLVDYDGYLHFLKQQTSRYESVFLVLGNHEFYGMTYESGLEKAHALVREPSLDGKILLLHKSRWDDAGSGLTILGCTLWSAIPDTAHDIVRAKINDFKKIKEWSVEKHNELHSGEEEWLRGQVHQIVSQKEETETRKVLVITHYAPAIKGTSSPQHSKDPWTSAFATDLLLRGDWTGVKTWIFGHTHYSTDFVLSGVRLVANQRGYVLPGGSGEGGIATRKSSIHDFDSSRTITITA